MYSRYIIHEYAIEVLRTELAGMQFRLLRQRRKQHLICPAVAHAHAVIARCCAFLQVTVKSTSELVTNVHAQWSCAKVVVVYQGGLAVALVGHLRLILFSFATNKSCHEGLRTLHRHTEANTSHGSFSFCLLAELNTLLVVSAYFAVMVVAR